jgi:hypothetical protein
MVVALSYIYTTPCLDVWMSDLSSLAFTRPVWPCDRMRRRGGKLSDAIGQPCCGNSQHPIRSASLFKQDPLQGLKQNPATGSATVQSTLCVEAVSSYKCQLTGIEWVKTHFIYCAVCRFTVDPSQKSGEASCCFDFFGNTPKVSASLAARTGKSACITTYLCPAVGVTKRHLPFHVPNYL